MDQASMLPKGRQQLSSVIAGGGDFIRIADVEATLHLSRTEAAKRLSRWAKQGWLHRVGSGTYAPVSLDTLGAQQVIDDPWVLVPTLYSPCYIGGRTAAEHWDLTEQIFKDIVVITAQPLRATRQIRHGTPFTLRHTSSEKMFGTKTLWRKRSRVQVSDVHRTIVDMLDEPALGAGIQQVADCFVAYLARSDRDDRRLLEYATRIDNGAIFKRLGFLAERSGKASHLADTCANRLTAGTANLDPAVKDTQLIPRWRLHVPRSWMPSKTK